MDINVHVTFDASDKLAHLIHELASAVSHCGKPEPASTPEHRAAYEVSATPEHRAAYEVSAVPEPAPKSEPAPKPEPAPTTAPTNEPAQNAEKAKALTIDDVRRVCLRATKAGKTKVVMDFLDAQGVKNLPALDPKLYDALVTIVEDNL